MTHLYQYLYFHNRARHSRFLQLHLIQCFCLRYILHSGSVYTQNAISFHYLHLNWCSSIQCMHHTLVYHVRCAMTECLVDQFSWILNFPLLLLLLMIPDVCSWILSSDRSPESERLAAQHSFCWHMNIEFNFLLSICDLILNRTFRGCLSHLRLSTCYGSARRRGRIPLELHTFISCYY
jgi:hypothetical protein